MWSSIATMVRPLTTITRFLHCVKWVAIETILPPSNRLETTTPQTNYQILFCQTFSENHLGGYYLIK